MTASIVRGRHDEHRPAGFTHGVVRHAAEHDRLEARDATTTDDNEVRLVLVGECSEQPADVGGGPPDRNSGRARSPASDARWAPSAATRRAACSSAASCSSGGCGVTGAASGIVVVVTTAGIQTFATTASAARRMVAAASIAYRAPSEPS